MVVPTNRLTFAMRIRISLSALLERSFSLIICINLRDGRAIGTCRNRISHRRTPFRVRVTIILRERLHLNRIIPNSSHAFRMSVHPSLPVPVDIIQRLLIGLFLRNSRSVCASFYHIFQRLPLLGFLVTVVTREPLSQPYIIIYLFFFLLLDQSVFLCDVPIRGGDTDFHRTVSTRVIFIEIDIKGFVQTTLGLIYLSPTIHIISHFSKTSIPNHWV